MSTTVERLKTEVVMLTEEERADLAYFLINTLEPEAETGVESAWTTEIKRRADEIKSRSVTGKPADQVFAEIRARHS